MTRHLTNGTGSTPNSTQTIFSEAAIAATGFGGDIVLLSNSVSPDYDEVIQKNGDAKCWKTGW